MNVETPVFEIFKDGCSRDQLTDRSYKETQLNRSLCLKPLSSIRPSLQNLLSVREPSPDEEALSKILFKDFGRFSSYKSSTRDTLPLVKRWRVKPISVLPSVKPPEDAEPTPESNISSKPLPRTLSPLEKLSNQSMQANQSSQSQHRRNEEEEMTLGRHKVKVTDFIVHQPSKICLDTLPGEEAPETIAQSKSLKPYRQSTVQDELVKLKGILKKSDTRASKVQSRQSSGSPSISKRVSFDKFKTVYKFSRDSQPSQKRRRNPSQDD